MVVFDSPILFAVFSPYRTRPKYPGTGNLVEKPVERIEYLIEDFSRREEKIIIPTPVLTEVLALGGDVLVERLQWINARRAFLIADFDKKAAIEAANPTYRAIQNREDDNDRVRIKFDEQIIAIAKTMNARAIYSDDGPLANRADEQGVKVIRRT